MFPEMLYSRDIASESFRNLLNLQWQQIMGARPFRSRFLMSQAIYREIEQGQNDQHKILIIWARPDFSGKALFKRYRERKFAKSIGFAMFMLKTMDH
jgi:hypothetical protein